MILCVVCLCVDGSQKEDNPSLGETNKKLYAFLAVLMGMIAPLFFCWKATFARLADGKYKYKCFDMAIDGQILEFFIFTIAYLVYLRDHPFVLSDFW